MSGQPKALARAREQRQREALARRQVEALERIADALEALQIVPLPERGRVGIRIAKAGAR